MKKKIKDILMYILVSTVILAFVITLIPFQLLSIWLSPTQQPPQFTITPSETTSDESIDNNSIQITPEVKGVDVVFEPIKETIIE